ncbi:MAG: putative oxidoreductase [Saprospiraceae bacterium]|jgi:putative oxidoreductase|tara:strand:- start:822 stop:1238 length:417 start_codon:yes stop_codon:yes gene_type:complete
MKGIADLLGRIFLSTIFFFEVLDTIFFYSNAKVSITNYGITSMQDTLLITVLVMMGIGAFLVVIGYFARVGALLLLIVWIPFTFIVYSFWNDPPDLQREQMVFFMRNLALIGGLLLLLANGSGEYSVRRLIHVMRLPK